MRGMYWTSVTDRNGAPDMTLKNYPDGVVGYATTSKRPMIPKCAASGCKRAGLFGRPHHSGGLPGHLDYGVCREVDPRWEKVVRESVEFMLASELETTGLYYNGFNTETLQWIGDFENPSNAKGQHLKVIQELWTALHLARASSLEFLDEALRTSARDAASRTLEFFRTFYAAQNRVPEYLTLDGKDVADCAGADAPADCLQVGFDNLWYGEARIYTHWSTRPTAR